MTHQERECFVHSCCSTTPAGVKSKVVPRTTQVNTRRPEPLMLLDVILPASRSYQCDAFCCTLCCWIEPSDHLLEHTCAHIHTCTHMCDVHLLGTCHKSTTQLIACIRVAGNESSSISAQACGLLHCVRPNHMCMAKSGMTTMNK